MIEAGAPRQHAADIEPLAFDLPEHVGRIDAFGRRRVVRAPGRVDVMVAAVEAARRRIDPALELHGDFRVAGLPIAPFGRRGNLHGARDRPVLGPTAVGHRELTGRQQHVLAVRSVDVLLEKQVGRQPFRLRREHVPLAIHELEPAGGRCPVVVQDAEPDRDGGLHGEQDGDLGAKPEVLRPLAHVKRDRGLAPARLARIDQRERVLGFEPAQVRRHRRGGEHLQIEKAIGLARGVLVLAQALLLHPLAGEPRHARVDRARLRAPDAEPLHAGALVDDLHDHRRVAGLLQHRRRRSTRDLDPRFRVDVHGEQHMGIEQFLQPLRVASLAGPRQIGAEIGRPRRPEIVQRFSQTLNIGRERLRLDGDRGQARGALCGKRLRPARGERVFERRSASSEIGRLTARRLPVRVRRAGQQSNSDRENERGMCPHQLISTGFLPTNTLYCPGSSSECSNGTTLG